MPPMSTADRSIDHSLFSSGFPDFAFRWSPLTHFLVLGACVVLVYKALYIKLRSRARPTAQIAQYTMDAKESASDDKMPQSQPNPFHLWPPPPVPGTELPFETFGTITSGFLAAIADQKANVPNASSLEQSSKGGAWRRHSHPVAARSLSSADSLASPSLEVRRQDRVEYFADEEIDGVWRRRTLEFLSSDSPEDKIVTNEFVSTPS